MRKLIINLAAFTAYGVIISAAGFGMFTWQYWVLLGLLIVIQVNNGVD